MQKSRREVIDELLDFVGELEDAEARNTAERLLNRALEGIWMKRAWSQFVSPAPLQIQLVANQRSYALPDHFGRLRSLEQAARNATRGSWISYLGEQDMLERYPDAGTTLETASDPCYCTILGTVGVYGQPLVTGEALEVLSSSVADIDIRVSIIGDDANGNNTRDQVTLNGTTPVAIGTWSYVDEVGKAFPADEEPTTEYFSSRGNVTLRKVSGTVLQQLFPQESARQHRVLTVYPKPSAADVLVVPFVRGLKLRVHDADPTPINWGPALFEEMLIQWRAHNGEVRDASQVARPAFLDLWCYENEQTQHVTRPFGS